MAAQHRAELTVKRLLPSRANADQHDKTDPYAYADSESVGDGDRSGLMEGQSRSVGGSSPVESRPVQWVLAAEGSPSLTWSERSPVDTDFTIGAVDPVDDDRIVHHGNQVYAFPLPPSRDPLSAPRAIVSSDVGSSLFPVATTPEGGPPRVEQILEWLGEMSPWSDEASTAGVADPHNPTVANCGPCTIAVYRRLNGIDSNAQAGREDQQWPQMSEATGLIRRETSFREIESALMRGGAGANTVVGFDRASKTGHWFNAYFDGFQVWAIDGQTVETMIFSKELLRHYDDRPEDPIVWWQMGVRPKT